MLCPTIKYALSSPTHTLAVEVVGEVNGVPAIGDSDPSPAMVMPMILFPLPLMPQAAYSFVPSGLTASSNGKSGLTVSLSKNVRLAPAPMVYARIESPTESFA